MATKTYEILDTNDLNFGTEGSTARLSLASSGAVSIPGTLAVTGATTLTGGITGAITATTTVKATTNYIESYEKVTTTGSSDVADPDVATTLITSGGAHTVTLADGTTDGQIKKIIISDVTAGTITITPANFADGTSMTMAEVLDCAELLWDGTNWNIIGGSGIAIV